MQQQQQSRSLRERLYRETHSDSDENNSTTSTVYYCLWNQRYKNNYYWQINKIISNMIVLDCLETWRLVDMIKELWIGGLVMNKRHDMKSKLWSAVLTSPQRHQFIFRLILEEPQNVNKTTEITHKHTVTASVLLLIL